MRSILMNFSDVANVLSMWGHILTFPSEDTSKDQSSLNCVAELMEEESTRQQDRYFLAQLEKYFFDKYVSFT